jgi:acetyltransferase-like isoleucine patch superfamily enzyme
MSKLYIFMFNLIPNIYLLKYAKEFFLKVAGIGVSFNSVYILSPFYIDNTKKLSISKGVFINKCVVIEGNGIVEIGKNCQIGPNVIIVTTNHNPEENMECVVKDVLIKENVWIGAGAIINPGITIGPDVTVASGSIVTKSFQNCTIAGIPARKIKNNV